MTESGNEHRDARAEEAERAPEETTVERHISGVAEEDVARSVTTAAVTAGGESVVADDDGDEETWTNQPKESLDGPESDGGHAEGDDEDEHDEEDDEAVAGEREAPAPKRAIRDARDVLMYELVARASQAKARLKPYLGGAIGVELSNSGEQFLLDWKGEDLKVAPASEKLTVEAAEEASAASRVDCIISLSETNLMAVRSGDLNPQVAMIADKIRVRGKVTPAVYLFNLIAPRTA